MNGFRLRIYITIFIFYKDHVGYNVGGKMKSGPQLENHYSHPGEK